MRICSTWQALISQVTPAASASRATSATTLSSQLAASTISQWLPTLAVLQAGVGQQFGDHFLQFTEVGAHVLYQVVAYFGVDLLVQLLEFEGQAGDRRAQFVGYRVGQFARGC